MLNIWEYKIPLPVFDTHPQFQDYAFLFCTDGLGSQYLR